MDDQSAEQHSAASAAEVVPQSLWEYNPDEWVRTRSVEVVSSVPAEGGDTVFSWLRTRTGPEGKLVASGGSFAELRWALLSATKENFPAVPFVTDTLIEASGFASRADLDEAVAEIDDGSQDPV